MSDITPDDKDWTWTLRRTCPDCGLSAAEVAPEDIAETVRLATAPWSLVLRRDGVRVRPAPTTWSPLEYACHVRDVCDLFAARLRLMLDEDNPRFANWDQDLTAVEKAYGASDPDTVAAELAAAAADLAAGYEGVRADQWDRPGLRSNGSVFTVATLGQYALHDLIHHLSDVAAVASGGPGD